jgi:two-component system response regulator YesN
MHVEPAQFKGYFVSLLHRISAKLPEFKEALDDLAIRGSDLGEKILEAGTVNDLKDQLMSAFYQIANRISSIRQDRSKKPVEIAKEYIKKHFDEDISLKTVADIVFMNPSYFSELFKNETGKNFIDFLIDTRIAAAKTYLTKPEIKIYEIGQLVGYDEPVSFNRTFKKVVGVSPLQYRKLIK